MATNIWQLDKRERRARVLRPECNLRQTNHYAVSLDKGYASLQTAVKRESPKGVDPDNTVDHRSMSLN